MAAGRFIDAVRQLPDCEVHEFVEWWCRARFDEGTQDHPIPLRMAFLSDIVLPVLVNGKSARRNDCARWLGQLLAGVPSLEKHELLAPRVPDFREMMEEAIALDPADDRARRLLLRCLVRGIGYSLHELPMLLASTEEIVGDVDRAVQLAGELQRAEEFGPWLDRARQVAVEPRNATRIDAYSRLQRPEILHG